MNNHPWNKSFKWQNHIATSGVLSQAQIDQFDQDGYVVVNDIFSAEELRDLVAITDAADAEAVAVLAAQPNERIAISERVRLLLQDNSRARFPRFADLSKTPRSWLHVAISSGPMCACITIRRCTNRLRSLVGFRGIKTTATYL